MKNIANYISISRIVMSVLLIITKTFSIPFYIIYLYCGLSDMIDGFFARKYKITSEMGSKIDSMADIVFVFASLVKILPLLNLSKGVYVCGIIIIITKICNIILGYAHYKKMILPHNIPNKITGFCLFISPLLIQFVDIIIIEFLICILATFSAVYEGHYIRGKVKTIICDR